MFALRFEVENNRGRVPVIDQRLELTFCMVHLPDLLSVNGCLYLGMFLFPFVDGGQVATDTISDNRDEPTRSINRFLKLLTRNFKNDYGLRLTIKILLEIITNVFADILTIWIWKMDILTL